MIIVRLEGGLGNQMFQYAFGKSVAAHHNTLFKLDTGLLLDRTLQNTIFRDYDLSIYNLNVEIAKKNDIAEVLTNIPEYNIIEKLQFKFLNKQIPYFRKNEFYEKEFYSYDSTVFKSQTKAYFYGFWQNQNYFAKIENELRKDFSFTTTLNEQASKLIAAIKSENSVAINVRRTDYINDQKTNEFMGVISENYYSDAIKLIRQKTVKPKFYIFSDDIEWCREKFADLENHFIVDHSFAGEKFSSYLQLMSSCKNFIIPNSTFAWWAAWLNTSKEKVIVQPKKWVNYPAKDTSGLLFKNSFQL